MIQKQLRILVAGVLIVVPFAITVYVIWEVGTSLDNLGRSLLPEVFEKAWGLGIAVVVLGIYLIGLLTHFWMFQWMVGLLEKLVSRLPGAKTIYESVRDLLKLFGGNARRMGKSVLYTPPGSEITMLAIMTNERPIGIDAKEGPKVAIFLPYSYMFGGMTIYVPASSVCRIDMPVEQTLKLCATAQVGPERAKDAGEQAGGEIAETPQGQG